VIAFNFRGFLYLWQNSVLSTVNYRLFFLCLAAYVLLQRVDNFFPISYPFLHVISNPIDFSAYLFAWFLDNPIFRFPLFYHGSYDHASVIFWSADPDFSRFGFSVVGVFEFRFGFRFAVSFLFSACFYFFPCMCRSLFIYWLGKELGIVLLDYVVHSF